MHPFTGEKLLSSKRMFPSGRLDMSVGLKDPLLTYTFFSLLSIVSIRQFYHQDGLNFQKAEKLNYFLVVPSLQSHHCQVNLHTYFVIKISECE